MVGVYRSPFRFHITERGSFSLGPEMRDKLGMRAFGWDTYFNSGSEKKNMNRITAKINGNAKIAQHEVEARGGGQVNKICLQIPS